MKNIIRYVAVLSLIVSLAACGGGGNTDAPAKKTTALLTIGLTGTLPPSTAISGASFLMTLPAGVTPATSNGVVSSGVVTLSGVFSGSSLPAQTVYTAASGSTPGTLNVILASSQSGGVAASGEVAKINLLLSNDAQPTAIDLRISGASVFNSLTYDVIAGMGVSVASVVMQ